MKVTILGNNSALPAFGRHPSSQIVTVYGTQIMLDCGEGTQSQMQRYGLKFRNLHYILISHLHGDHYFGLPGLLNTMNMLGRTAPLQVFGPAPLEGILNQILAVADTQFGFPFAFHALPDGAGRLEETDSFTIDCFPVEHRIQCHGFRIVRKSRGRKLLPDRCAELGVPASAYGDIKGGADYMTPAGAVVPNRELTEDGPGPKQYAYCADTRFTDSFLDQVRGVDLIYHECTYIDQDQEKASARFHSTARQAAEVARMAGAKELLLGHFSSKYKELDQFLQEASEVFPNVRIAAEGASYEV